MRRILSALLLTALAVGIGGAVAAQGAGVNGDAAAIADGRLPEGYRDWRLISVAREEGELNDIRAILGNDIAVRAYRDGAAVFPDGAIVARLAWRLVPSPENNAAFGREQSFIAGPPTNVQFMVKDQRRYAATGGWSFSQFNAGAPAQLPAAACFACHVPVKARDYLFTKYAP